MEPLGEGILALGSFYFDPFPHIRHSVTTRTIEGLAKLKK